MLRHIVASDVLELDGEWLGSVLKSYLEIRIPAQVVIAGLPLDESQIEVLTAEMHLALSAMKLRHVIVRLKPWQPLTESDRDAVLGEFHQWMDQHGWKISVEREATRLSMRRKGIPWFPRREAGNHHVFEQGAWVARALHAMLNLRLDHTTLFVGEGADPLPWLVDLDW
ncbi:MAG: hypothetical protein JNL62_07065 [Bryobacterales bacterium]|nr:hypothetical protein [Bryobacterales bacterium]